VDVQQLVALSLIENLAQFRPAIEAQARPSGPGSISFRSEFVARSPGIASFEGSIVLVGTRDLYIDRYRQLVSWRCLRAPCRSFLEMGATLQCGRQVRAVSWARNTLTAQCRVDARSNNSNPPSWELSGSALTRRRCQFWSQRVGPTSGHVREWKRESNSGRKSRPARWLARPCARLLGGAGLYGSTQI